MDKINVIGKIILTIFNGFKPKLVITISSYSPESFAKAITIEIKNEIEQNHKRAKGNYARLYAMGIDAYRLYPRLKQLSALPNSKIFGVTGDLSLDFEGKIHRKMPFAIFKRGRPVALNLDKN